MPTGLVCETLQGRPQTFLRCPSCQSLFDQNPERFEYEAGYYIDNPLLDEKLYLEKGSSLRLFAHLVLQAERASTLARRKIKPGSKGKLWEAGCGAGLLLDLARFLGWDVLGLEPAPEVAEWGNKVLGIPILAKLLQKQPPITNADVAITSEVIEHLESPWDFTRAMARSLGPDGVMLLTTPNGVSKSLSEQGKSWVHLGLGYHLVLYSPQGLTRLLRQVGFQAVEITTFEGDSEDDRLIVLAAKRTLPSAVLRAILSCRFEDDAEASQVAIRYLWQVLRRFENEKNIYWQGAFFRLLEYTVAQRDYAGALEIAKQLENFLLSQGYTAEYTLSTLNEALHAKDRKIFYSKVPTFMGNFYFLRGVAELHCGRLDEALKDFHHSHSIADTLEQLPYKSYEELSSVPPSLTALFHIGFTLLKLERPQEASTVFAKMLASPHKLPPQTLAQTILQQAAALQKQEVWDQARNLLQRAAALHQEGKLPEALAAQVVQKQLELEVGSLQTQQHVLQTELGQARSQLAAAESEIAQVRAETQAEIQQLRARLESEEITRQALEETRRQLESELDRKQGELAQVYNEFNATKDYLGQEQHARRALELQFGQLRYRLVDRVNNLLKRNPRIHARIKALFLYAQRQRLRWIERSRKPNPLLLAPESGPAALAPLERITAEFAGCTIIAKNYLCSARVLANFFRQWHPDSPFFVLVVDRVDGHFDPRKEPFYGVSLDRLAIPHLERFLFKYNVLEVNTAVKPFFLSYLLREHSLEKLVYLDPDILVTNGLQGIAELLDEHSFVLTPHLTAPLRDGLHPGEFEFTQAGSYNLGFIALRNNPRAHQMLEWWQDRLYEKCLMAPERGMHVDQKWIDLVPGMFGETYILRDPGYNVAYWNLHERKVKVKKGTGTVNDEPLYFFHFSGFDPDNIEGVSRHQNRFKLSDLGDVRVLFERYRELVLAAGWRETKPWPYSWDYFDSGALIPEFARRLYWELGEEAVRFGNPFSPSESPSFFAWLNEPVDSVEVPARRVTRLWHRIYQSRVDLLQAYPDVLGVHRGGFLSWILHSGRNEHNIDAGFILNDPQKRMTVRQNAAVAPPRVKEERTTSVKTLRETSLPFGVNVAGYLQSEKGVGEAGRANIRSLEAAGIPYVVNNFADVHGSVNIENAISKFSEGNPYKFNLIQVNADQVPIFAQERNGFFLDRYNIGVWNWELSQFPERWWRSFEYFNELWAPSKFIAEGLSQVSQIPIVHVPYSINPETRMASEWTRARFGFNADDFVFLFLFDFYSYAVRKNPIGLVRAFRQAFADEKDAVLLIKCSHSDFDRASFAALQAACGADNIKLYDGVLPREAVNFLMATADCYVSLHHSEGFGLTLAEAMSLGKPVIATAYSGNMDFMTPNNSYLVDYRIVEIEQDYGPYSKGYVWADPDLDHAAQLMRCAFENREQAAAIGQQARQDLYANLHPRVAGKRMRERLSLINP